MKTTNDIRFFRFKTTALAIYSSLSFENLPKTTHFPHLYYFPVLLILLKDEVYFTGFI